MQASGHDMTSTCKITAHTHTSYVSIMYIIHVSVSMGQKQEDYVPES